jgi:hypothetical protein
MAKQKREFSNSPRTENRPPTGLLSTALEGCDGVLTDADRVFFSGVIEFGPIFEPETHVGKEMSKCDGDAQGW